MRIALLTIFLLIAASAPNARAEAVRITLKPNARATADIVRVGNVANVMGGDARLRSEIQSMDIADAPAIGKTAHVSRTQLGLRLLLAGLEAEEFQLVGELKCVITRSNGSRLSDESVLRAIRDALEERLQISDEDLDLRLTQPLPPGAYTQHAAQVRVEPRLPTVVRPGPLRVQTAVYVEEKMVNVIPVSVEARVKQTVIRATQKINVGHTFTAANTRQERRAIGGAEAGGIADAVLGKQASRTIDRGAIIKTYDIRPESRTPQSFAVQSRQTVRLVAQKGVLRVTLSNAQSLDRGRLGETVRVRNPQTNKIINATVTGPGQVQAVF